MTYIKERIIELAKNKGVRVEDFAVNIGMTYSSFKGNAKFTPLNSDAIVNILTLYKDVNAEWILTGDGSMLKELALASQQVTASQSKEYKEETTSEFINKICELSAENALLRKENEELKELHKKRSGNTPISIAAEPNVEYGKQKK
jgi:phage repressor protein C with HTH and peptisase S24 domain